MSGRRRQLADGARFVWGVSKGVRRGDLFPRAGRRPLTHAPGGTTQTARTGSLLQRARHEVGWFTETVHQVPVPGLSRGLRVLHLTDVHLRTQGPWLDALCASLTSIDTPDMVVLTGDLVTRGWTPQALDQFLVALPVAALGTYAVMGNWEYWSGAEPGPWRSRLSRAGVQLLINEAATAGPLALYGTDDALAGEPNPTAPPCGDRPRLVLTHSPVLFDRLVDPATTLVLAGHSHAGQVRLPLLGAAWVPMGTSRYVGGWYVQDRTRLYVSPGVGWSIAPVRMWCPPELAWLHLAPATSPTPAVVAPGA